MNSDLLKDVKQRAEAWLNAESIDSKTKEQVKYLLENDENELIESFYRDLEFGTGGLRGIMGAGTNRMNIYTVGMATQGLANYLLKQFPSTQIKVAIAYDSRNNGKDFAEAASKIFVANGINVYLFESLRPTPELSFAIRHFGCQSGVVVTASHNPKEYNGYKVYWSDGGQVIAPHDINIIDEVLKIKSVDDVKWGSGMSGITIVGNEVDDIYLAEIKKLSLSPDIIAANKTMKIVYTPIHGTGVKLVPASLKNYGFENIIHVEEQDVVSGDFPTVKSPNPEEPAAMSLAIEKAKATGAELVIATDPDADRVGIAARNNNGEFELLNGNQTGSILIYYLLNKWKENGKLTGKEFIVKTIVTTELLAAMAKDFEVECFDVLTGFKFIADAIKSNEGIKKFIGGGEESYGYLCGDFVRDKDAVMSASLIAEASAWAFSQGKSLFDLLAEIYMCYGFYREKLVNIVKKGKSGAEEIQQMMADFRSNPPKTICGSQVVCIKDYKVSKAVDMTSNTETTINLPKSNVLQFITADGTIISVRPSGTEPKIKFYIGTKMNLDSAANYQSVADSLNKKIADICADLKL